MPNIWGHTRDIKNNSARPSTLTYSQSGSATPEAQYGTRTDLAAVNESLHWSKLDGNCSPNIEQLEHDGSELESQEDVPESLNDRLLMDDEDDLYEMIPHGVRKMSAIYSTLSKRSFLYLCGTVVLISFVISTESQVTPAIEPYFLSLFKSHALLSTVSVVVSIAFAVGKPPMAQVLDHYGRPEGLAVSAACYACGFFLTAISSSFSLFATARVLSALGGQGLQLSQQVLIADLSTLSNRALLTGISSLPWVITIWIGPPLGQMFLNLGEIGYRFAYVVFGMLVPILCMPLILTLWWHHKRLRDVRALRDDCDFIARKSSRIVSIRSFMSAQTTMSWLDRDASTLLGEVWRQLDIAGLLLLSTACVGFLLPLSLAATQSRHWHSMWIYASFAMSAISACILIVHEKRVERPFLPRRLCRNTTLIAGCLLGFCHFVSCFVYESYFTSFLQVARHRTVVESQYISMSYVASATLAAFFVGWLCKLSKSYKIWAVAGVLMHICGSLLMVVSRRPGMPTYTILAAQIVSGIGGGFTTLCAQTGLQSTVIREDVAKATAAFLTITQIGGAVGSAVAGALWTSILPHQMVRYLPLETLDQVDDIIGSLSTALSFPPGSDTRNAIDHAYNDTQHILNMAALISLMPALFCVLKMRSVALIDELNTASPIVRLDGAKAISDERPSPGGEESGALLSISSLSGS